MFEERKPPTPVIGGVQIEALEVIDSGIMIAEVIPVGDRVLWSLGGHQHGVTMVVGGTFAEMVALAHRLLDLVAELEEVAS